MATEVILPRQGQSVESCIVLDWKVQEGEAVKEGDVICEVETDKATFEIESTASGVLLKHLASEGDDVPVLSPLALVGEEGEEPQIVDDRGTAREEQPQATEGAAPQPAGEPSTAAPARTSPEPPATPKHGDRIFVSPRARAIAAAKGVDPAALTGTGPGGRIIERDVTAALGERAPVSPAATAEMVETGKRAPAVGTGPGGRIVSRDLAAAGAPAAEQASAQSEAATGPVEEIELKGVRKLIAERMHASLLESAQLTLNSSADARAILSYRRRIKEADESIGLSAVTINDLILYVVSRALQAYPEMNATLRDGVIRRFANVHLGFAVDTPRGLMVPVIRNAETMSLKQMGTESSRLADACMSGKIDPDELAGGTFTVTNLGSLGVTSFTPVLNTPQVGILGVGAVEPKPVLVDREYEFRPHIALSLTIDHRAVDGAPGARFLREVGRMLSDFELTLAG